MAPATPTIRATLPIDPAAGLYLAVLSQGAAARFANLFRKAWRRIPASDRQLLLRHWHGDHEARRIGRPAIQYADHWPDRYHGEIASTSWGGGRLKFLSVVVDCLPEASVCDLIAHELAHAYLVATNKSPPPDRKPRRESPAEQRADGLARSWGFDPDSIGIWDALVYSALQQSS